MKKYIKLLLINIFVFCSFSVWAQNNKIQEVTIQSSIQCGECVERLDDAFADIWSVKSVEYNTDDQTIIVRYNAKKITVEEIREVISETGYDADDVPAQIDAYLELTECCRKGNHVKEHN